MSVSRVDPNDDRHRVMGAIDGSGGVERLVIADVSQDRAWLAAPLTDTCRLTSWR